MQTAAAPRLAAVIPTWNRRDLLVTLLKSLTAQTRSFQEIIVVYNGSTDDSANLAERAGAKVLRLGRNLGEPEKGLPRLRRLREEHDASDPRRDPRADRLTTHAYRRGRIIVAASGRKKPDCVS